jgi:single-stranded-DNA-specific exonuclease
VTVAPDAIPAFREAFERHAASVLSDDDLVPRTRIDGWVDAAALDDRAATDLEKLAPFGAGNPEPVFGVRARPSRARQVGAAGIHLKLVLADRDAIAFQMGDRLPLCAGPVEAAVSVGFDDWDGMRRLQLRVRDLRAAPPSPGA